MPGGAAYDASQRGLRLACRGWYDRGFRRARDDVSVPAPEAALAIGIALLVVAALAGEWLAAEAVGLLTIVALAVSGILEPREAFAGFGSPVVVMIAGILLMTGALVHNGVPQLVVRRIQSVPLRWEGLTRLLLLAAVNGVSAFINNVAATAMFIPVAEGLARRMKTHRRAMLMPVAFASLTGGLCTLIGTSTNVAVAGRMLELGMEPLGFFELTPIGLAVATLGTVYLAFLAPRLLRPADAAEGQPSLDPELREFLYEVQVFEGAPLAGRTMAASDPSGSLGLTVLAIQRGSELIDAPAPTEVIREKDVLLVKSRAERISELRDAPGFRVVSMPPVRRAELLGDTPRIAEVTVSWNSPLIGKTLDEVDFRHQFGVSVLAVHRRTEMLARRVSHIPLRAGDVLLVYGRPELIDRLGQGSARLLVTDVVAGGESPRKAVVSGAIFAAAVASVLLAGVDGAVAFLAGGALVLASGCLPASQVARYAAPRFLILLAGLVALGTGLERSGAAAWIADSVLALVGADPLALLVAVFALTVLLTQPLTNAAAALLVLPIAISAAQSLGVDARPFVITVTVAASCSFLTPFEPACLLVYGTGHYRFRDFPRAGAPLTALVLALTALLVPRLWPFTSQG
jgi:di/tricarboxylate transporter